MQISFPRDIFRVRTLFLNPSHFELESNHNNTRWKIHLSPSPRWCYQVHGCRTWVVLCFVCSFIHLSVCLFICLSVRVYTSRYLVSYNRLLMFIADCFTDFNYFVFLLRTSKRVTLIRSGLSCCQSSSFVLAYYIRTRKALLRFVTWHNIIWYNKRCIYLFIHYWRYYDDYCYYC